MKKGFIIGVVCTMLVIIGVTFYCNWYNSVEHLGIKIDYDDPWMFNGSIHYYTEWIDEQGSKQGQWISEDKALFMVEQRKKGKIVYPGKWE